MASKVIGSFSASKQHTSEMTDRGVADLSDASTMKDLKQAVKVPPIAYVSKEFRLERVMCFICQVVYDHLYQLESHQLYHSHCPKTEDKEENAQKRYMCRKCTAEMPAAKRDNHKCLQLFDKEMLTYYQNVAKYGLPLFCLLCEMDICDSIGELIIHLIAYHSDNQASLKCAICEAIFRTPNRLVKYLHMQEQHWGSMQLKLLELKPLQIHKRQNNLFSDCYVCICLMLKTKNICGMTFKSLPNFTAHVLCCHVPVNVKPENVLWKIKTGAESLTTESDRTTATQSTSRMTLDVIKSVHIDLECHWCRVKFTDTTELDKHINSDHCLEMQRTLDYHIRRGHVKKTLNPFLTCQFCMKIFPDNLSKQIHFYCQHYSGKWYSCGLCDQQEWFIIDLKDKGSSLSSNIIYRYMLVHERLHIEAIKKHCELVGLNMAEMRIDPPILKKITSVTTESAVPLINYPDFVMLPDTDLEQPTPAMLKRPSDVPLTLVEAVPLYQHEYVPRRIKQQREAERLKKKPVFPKDFKKYLVQLGVKNRIDQEALELFG